MEWGETGLADISLLFNWNLYWYRQQWEKMEAVIISWLTIYHPINMKNSAIHLKKINARNFIKGPKVILCNCCIAIKKFDVITHWHNMMHIFWVFLIFLWRVLCYFFKDMTVKRWQKIRGGGVTQIVAVHCWHQVLLSHRQPLQYNVYWYIFSAFKPS